MMYIQRTIVEIIKLSLASTHLYSISSKDVLLESIRWLKNQYEISHNKLFLDKAVQHIYAFIELGFPFQDNIREFEGITDCLEIPLEELFPENMWKYSKIKLSKSTIHNLLGRWNPGLHSMRVTQVIEDIYSKVVNNQEGEYLYHSGKILCQDDKDILWEQTFKLFIQAEEAIFYDVNKNRYYVFEKRDK